MIHKPGARVLLLTFLTLGPPVAAQESQPPKRTVHAKVQPRPGAPVVEFEMPVHAVPVDPVLVSASEAELLGAELVLGLARGDEALAVPISLLANYEVLNSRVGDLPIAPTW